MGGSHFITAFWQSLELFEIEIGLIVEGTSSQVSGQGVQQILFELPPGQAVGQQVGSNNANACI